MIEILSDDLRERIASSAPLRPEEVAMVPKEAICILQMQRDPTTRTGLSEEMYLVGLAVGVAVDGLLVHVAVLNKDKEIDPITKPEREDALMAVIEEASIYKKGDNISLLLTPSSNEVVAYAKLPPEDGGDVFITLSDGETQTRNFNEFVDWVKTEIEEDEEDEG